MIHEILRLDRTGYIESEQGDGLTKIIDLLPLDASLLLEKVYHTIRTFSARDVRASLLARLAQRLSSTNAELLQKIFDDIRSIDWSSERIKALVTISKQVPPDEKQNLIDEVLTLAFNNPDSYYPDHKCKLKDPQCHSEAVFCRRICGSTPEILRIQPLRMTQPLLKFTLMLPRHTVYSNR